MCHSTHKRGPVAWEAGQDIEGPAVRALLPAFGRFVRVIWAHVDALTEGLTDESNVLAILAPDSLPWDEAREKLIDPWREVAEKSFALAASQVHAEKFRATKEIDPNDVRALAYEWAFVHALELADTMTSGSREGVRQALLDAINANENPMVAARRLRESVGLSQRDAQALDRLRTVLRGQGASQGRIDREMGRAATKARKRRALTIARTEINRARNEGTQASWRVLVDQGELPTDSMKVWIPNPGCRICVSIAEQGPVPYDGFWVSPTGGYLRTPPAHPNCRCSHALYFPSL